MMYVHYALYATIALVAFVFTYITCPLWAFIAALLKLDRLPGPLGWVHTHDDNVYGAKYRRSHDMDAANPIPQTFGKRFTTACWWIWRNPNYGFNSEVLGLPVKGTTLVSDVKTGTDNDYVRWTIFHRGGHEYFGYAANWPYGKNKFVKIWIGWQWHPLDGSDRYMLKFSFNPWMTSK